MTRMRAIAVLVGLLGVLAATGFVFLRGRGSSEHFGADESTGKSIGVDRDGVPTSKTTAIESENRDAHATRSEEPLPNSARAHSQNEDRIKISLSAALIRRIARGDGLNEVQDEELRNRLKSLV